MVRLRKLKEFVDNLIEKSDKKEKDNKEKKEMEKIIDLRLQKIKEQEKKLEAERIRKYIEEQRNIKRMKRENGIEEIRKKWTENGDKQIDKELKMSKMKTRFLNMLA